MLIKYTQSSNIFRKYISVIYHSIPSTRDRTRGPVRAATPAGWREPPAAALAAEDGRTWPGGAGPTCGLAYIQYIKGG